MFEIYNDQVHDLLEEGNRNLQLREKTNEGVYVSGLTSKGVETTQDILDTINLGFELRSTASTNMNAVSSRSHCLVNIALEQRNPTTGFLKNSKLYLVDLAGSEKVKKTGATGSTLKEATAINKSLSALGKIISLLSKVNMEEQKSSKKTGGNTPKKRRKGWKWEKKQRNTYSIQGFQTYAHTSKFPGWKCKNCVAGSVFTS